MKLKNLCSILFAFLLAACSFTSPNPPTSVPAVNLPDLVVDSINVGMVDANCRCLNGYYIQARILNQGNAPTEGVVAMEMSTGQQVTLSRLEAGKSVDIQIPAVPSTGTYLINVDPQNVIPESNETNNNLSFLLPTPTPFAGCAASPDNTTPLPPTLPPSAQALDGLIYANMDSAQIFRIISGGQGVAVLQGTSAQFSPNGILALFESSGDIFLAEPMDNPDINLTHTPDRLESTPQWLPSNTLKVVFNSKGVNEAQEKGWGNDVLGYLSMMNTDGSEYFVLADIPSYTAPALLSDGSMIAYEQSGMPMLYEIGKGSHPFNPTLYGFQPSAEAVFTSPSFSSFGRWLTWWVSENSSQPDKHFSLVLFDLNANTSATLYSYAPLTGTSGWLPNPVWNGNEDWIAYQTRGETTAWDLWISRPDGNDAYRLGLATDPVWSPDLERLAYVQWPPRSNSYLAASASIIEVPSWNVQPMNLPSGSILLGWTLPTLLDLSYFPKFTAPADWLIYSNANPPYQIQYPPTAKFEAYPEKLTINFLPQPGDNPTEKSITIETRAGTMDHCYAFSAWDGKTVLNGFDLNYYGGKRFEIGSDGTEFLIGNYAAYRDGFCFTIQSRMAMSSSSDLRGENMDPETLLNVISTLTLY
jgi:hypothetical protein